MINVNNWLKMVDYNFNLSSDERFASTSNACMLPQTSPSSSAAAAAQPSTSRMPQPTAAQQQQQQQVNGGLPAYNGHTSPAQQPMNGGPAGYVTIKQEPGYDMVSVSTLFLFSFFVFRNLNSRT